MANAAEIMQAISKAFPTSVNYPVLTPNMKGFEAALKSGAKEIAVFGAASETFSQKNINCSIKESLERFLPVCEAAKKNGIRVRGYDFVAINGRYVSCVVGCPYEGQIEPGTVAYVASKLHEMGCYEISLGDTIGVGTPYSIAKMIEKVGREVDVSKLAIHAHDTYGQALVNIYQSLTMGITTVDSSIGGLGGCPYAKGATGNVATEDVVFMLTGMGYDIGDITLSELSKIGQWISDELGRPNASRAGSAIYRKGQK
jgi:hydroxymethylglutaryl-CoA lyase